MRRCAFIVIAILIIPCFAHSKDLLWDEEMISNANVLLYQQVSKTEAKSGSGTIISKGSRYYILTASHISNLKTRRAEFHGLARG